jgi:hypothetical protein
MKMTLRQLLKQFDQALSEVRSGLASGELDGSGRFYTDEELAAGAATGRTTKPEKKKKEAPAA